MKRDPFLIEGPALLSFSGGRTSARMLRAILDAHGGRLPDDVFVAFANTSKERAETYDFIHRCESEWDVPVHWLQWVERPTGQEGRKVPAKDRFEVVNHNSAARNGEVFERLIARRSYVPNPVTRFCTMEMKIEVMKWFMQSKGFETWINIVGLRADEMLRVFKAYDRNENANQPFKTKCPLADAGIRKVDVDAFWRVQSFDLQIKGYEGNCDLCFLKGRARLKRLIRENPGMADWWIAMEERTGASFHSRWWLRDLARDVETSPLLPLDLHDDDEDFDASCDLICGGDEE